MVPVYRSFWYTGTGRVLLYVRGDVAKPPSQSTANPRLTPKVTRLGDSRPVWPGDFVFAASAWRTAGHPAKECGHRRLAACISPPQHKITPKLIVFALFAPWRYLCVIRVVPTHCVRLVGLPSGTSSAERTDVLTGMRSRIAAWRLINTLHLTFHFT